MEIKKYEILIRVIDRGSFVKACQDFGYTQSGITHMMNSLEREVGFPLLLRTNKGVKPSLAGEQILPLIRKLLQINERIEQEFAQIRGIKIGKLRVGCVSSTACVWMPRALHAFQKQYPLIRVELIEENNLFHLEQWLADGRLDLACLSCQTNRFQEWIPLKNDPYFIILPKGHRLTSRDCVTPADLMGETVFRSTDGTGPELEKYFEKNGIIISSTLTANSDHTMIHMVKQGLGIGFLPELSLEGFLETGEGGVITKAVVPPLHRVLGVAAHFDGSPAIARFITCLKETLQ